jgi:hypothetical protein
MNTEIKALKKALQNRQAELQQLIDQMKSDNLNKSSVFRHLETELSTIRRKLGQHESSARK